VAYLLLGRIIWPSSLFYKVENEQEAIDLANDAQHGGSIFTKDIKRTMQVADQIDSGMIFISDLTTQPDFLEELKGSGYDELSELEFMNL
jgi:succinate-semialdehyde dehydrogenase/glutarate-semialdehyde dehydrogenase